MSTERASSLQTIMVTGAASGIGRACVQLLLDRGHQVGAIDLRREAVQAALPVGAANVEAIACDVSRAEDCATAVGATLKRFGKLDALIHCAAIHSSTFWTELSAEELNRVLAVNVTGSFLIAQAVGRHLESQKHGAIVLTASTTVIAAGVGGAAGSGGPAYIASKAAITGLVRTMARALGPSGVRVNAIAPGVTETSMIRNYSPENRTRAAASSPLGRIGAPEEIADVACFLIADGARYMTGEIVIVNGGANFG
jgi:NAD(P)-dependent dehydrogenase (short-subunit alcohol dehydrogenase family)